MSFTHIVTFKWHEDDFDSEPVAKALRELISRLGGVQDYLCGPDIGLSPACYDFAVVGRFENREQFMVYRDHPEHQRIIKDMITPHLDDRTVVQLED